VSSLGKSFERQVFLPRHRSAPPPPPPTTRRTAAEHTSALSTRPLTPHATVRRRPRLLPPAPPPFPRAQPHCLPTQSCNFPTFCLNITKRGKEINVYGWIVCTHDGFGHGAEETTEASSRGADKLEEDSLDLILPNQSCNFLLQSRWVGGRASGFCLCEFG
jgi:hypothetical protein